ncbi:efflux RND transporter periplasmic adaptor subunit [Occallatibacter riparius]|uniref:Efflux RND transporter periplasmic adaptor subunit n=1 Tax=Occallatibacter riparius TaxID=1002689 RepID=A0A9J7BXU2_9BACT|nr:efflux RND transporter periplasmic adaptor subunit [Occallatibacter riparius]UWZ86077.1 efflux RND transporter periplasmic adaptor subunit [Occallatibacter riparius]
MQSAPELLKLERAIRSTDRVKRLARSASDCRIALLIPTLAVLIAATGCREKEAVAPPPVPDVEVTQVVSKDVPIYHEWVATLDGYVNAQVQPEVTGYLLAQKYQEGTFVKKGQLLFELDRRPFEAIVKQTEGQLAQTQAQLSKTELDVARDTPLAKLSAIPQAQLDNDIQANAAAKAGVVAAEAQVEQAKLNLNFTNVYSLVDGIAGMAKAQIGDLVGPTTVLTTVSQVNPIKAYVSLSEPEYLRAAGRISNAVQGKIDKRTGERNLDLILADGSTFATKGWLVFADRQVDEKTGTIRVAGAFDNPQLVLRPGQFGRIRANTTVAKDAMLVPQRAVVETQGLYSVMVVGDDNKVSVRPVKTGERIGQMWIITDGVKPGERVIVEGIQKAREGSVVNPKAAAAGSSEGE